MSRSSKINKPIKGKKDFNQIAAEIVRLSTEEVESTDDEKTGKGEKNPISEYLAEIGRKGGIKGGKARAEKLSAKRRKEIAQKAAKKRWGKD